MNRLIRQGFLLGLAAYTAAGCLHPESFWIINAADLIFHESGHPVFGLFGHFAGMAGGTLMQLLVPGAIAGAFWFQRQRFSACIMLWWFGQNGTHIAPYARDARAQELPLIGGGVHDWHYLLSSLKLLTHDQLIGDLFAGGGTLIMIASLYFAWIFSAEEPT